jgi:hypothetical protein
MVVTLLIAQVTLIVVAMALSVRAAQMIIGEYETDKNMHE